MAELETDSNSDLHRGNQEDQPKGGAKSADAAEEDIENPSTTPTIINIGSPSVPSTVPMTPKADQPPSQPLGVVAATVDDL